MKVYAQIVLAGGQARRLGMVAKSLLVYQGQTLLEHALMAGRDASHQVVVGPPELPVPDGVSLVREDPPLGGPVAGIGAGLLELDRVGCAAEWVLVTACDHAYAEAAAAELFRLVDALDLTEVDLVTPVGADGHRQTLFALYRRTALAAAIQAHGGGHNLSVRRLVADLRTLPITIDDTLLIDVDDPATAAQLGITVS